ncbi:hypothetical protein ScPMuIL_016194 [Solemya velum]
MICWNYTLAQTRAYQLCPSFIQGFIPSALVFKDCNPDGTWWAHPLSGFPWSNYTYCHDKKGHEQRLGVINMYFAGFAISLIFVAVALVIFSSFKQLKCSRVTLHKHLFVSYILTGLLWIVYYRATAMESTVLVSNPIWCQFLHCLTQYVTICKYAWMFSEGFYLHMLIVITFIGEKRMLHICYFIGWVFPLLPTATYSLIRSTNGDTSLCWMHETNLNWILTGPVTVMLIINLIFLFNILRILLSKLRAVNTNETQQTRRTVKAILILIPLLGLQYIAIPFRPPEGTHSAYIYDMISAFVVAFQGMFVALIFCFFNGEVMCVMKRRWNQMQFRLRKGEHRRMCSTAVTLMDSSQIPRTGFRNSGSWTKNCHSQYEETKDSEMQSMMSTTLHDVTCNEVQPNPEHHNLQGI